MKFNFKTQILLVVIGLSCSLHAGAVDAAQWSPKKVDWQVVRAQNASNENICAIRWSYDRAAQLSFENSENGYSFNLSAANGQKGDFPNLENGEKYSAMLERQDTSVAEFFGRVNEDGISRLDFGPSLTNINFFSAIKKITFVYEGSVIELPLPNAIENFEAYKKCMSVLTKSVAEISAQTEEDLEQATEDYEYALKYKKETAQTLDERVVGRAAESLDIVAQRALVMPPHMQQQRLKEDTKRIVEDAMQENLHANEYNASAPANTEMNRSLLKKLELLEKEKEQLRKKLLAVTKESFISDIVACEPNAKSKGDQDISSIIEESYKLTISQLRDENRKLRELVTEEQSFSLDE